MIIITVIHDQGAYTDDGEKIVVATVGAPSAHRGNQEGNPQRMG